MSSSVESIITTNSVELSLDGCTKNMFLLCNLRRRWNTRKCNNFYGSIERKETVASAHSARWEMYVILKLLLQTSVSLSLHTVDWITLRTKELKCVLQKGEQNTHPQILFQGITSSFSTICLASTPPLAALVRSTQPYIPTIFGPFWWKSSNSLKQQHRSLTKCDCNFKSNCQSHVCLLEDDEIEAQMGPGLIDERCPL